MVAAVRRGVTGLGLVLLPAVVWLAVREYRELRDLARLTAAYKTPKEPPCSGP